MLKSKKKGYISFLMGWSTALLSAALVYFTAIAPHVATAITVDTSLGASMGLGSASPESIVITIINWALGLLSLIAVVIILYAGFMWMTSHGDPERIQKAKKILIAALIGLFIILAAWGIVLYIMRLLNDATSGPGGNSCMVSSDCGGYPSEMCCSLHCVAYSSDGCSSFPTGSTGFYVDTSIPRKNQENVSLCTLIGAHFSDPVNPATLNTTPLDPDVLRNTGYTTDQVDRYYAQVYKYDSDGDGTYDANPKDDLASCTDNKECKSALCDSGACSGGKINGLVKIDASKRWVVLYPDGRELPKNTIFEATVDAEVDSAGGVSLSGGTYKWRFTTGEDIDSTPPQALEGQEFPRDGATEVCRKTPVREKFNEVMDPVSFDDRTSFILSLYNPNTQTADFEANPIPLNLIPLEDRAGGRPVDPLVPETEHYVRIYSGKPVCIGGSNADAACPGGDGDCNSNVCDEFHNAVMDACGNPLDGDRDGVAEGTTVDDFFSDNTTEVEPWNFTSGVEENLECTPIIDSITPLDPYDALDNSTPLGPDITDNGGDGDPGSVTIAGKFLGPDPIITFDGNIKVWPGGAPACFDTDTKMSSEPPPTGLCVVEDTSYTNEGQIYSKISPNARDRGPVKVEVYGEVSDPSADEPDLQSPHINATDPDDGNVGQYVTLFGHDFGDEPGVVWFRGASLNIPGGVPPLVCGDVWTDEEIVTVVPSGFTLNDLVEIQVETAGDDNNYSSAADNKRGNLTPFTITNTNRPNLCNVVPNCSNAEDTAITYIGQRFQPTRGKAWFGALSAKSISSWVDDQVVATTPYLERARYAARIETSSGLSNSRTFSVPCGNVPQVANINQCDLEASPDPIFPSTNPRPNQKNVCLNIDVAARFTLKMDVSTGDNGILNSNNIKLYKCLNVDNDCTSPIGVMLGEDPVYADYNNSVVLSLSGDLEVNTWYALEVSEKVRSVPECFHGTTALGTSCTTNEDCGVDELCGGVEMGDTFVGKFLTKEDPGPCPVSQVLVTPSSYTVGGDPVLDFPKSGAYTSILVGPNCALLAGSYAYAWSSSDTTIATISGSTSKNETATTAGIKEGTAKIMCEVEGKRDDGLFRVNWNYCLDDTDCYCGASCVNHMCNPIIKRITPNVGPVGRSVTVEGCYFGSTQESGDKVTFKNTEANLVDFCAVPTWSDKQIIVEVPDPGVTDPKVKVTNKIGTEDFISNEMPFTIADVCVKYDGTQFSIPDTIPTLCPLDPDSAKIGDTLPLTGKGFGTSQTIGKDYVVYDTNATPKVDTATPYDQWSNTNIKSKVPTDTQGGYMVAANDECISNSSRLWIKCDGNSDCTSGCCKGGVCQDSDVCASHDTGPGEPCYKASMCEDRPGVCSSQYECKDNSSTDCRCCCTPGDIIVSGGATLVCEKNIDTCTTSSRGMYCGCSKDSECPNTSYAGCGVYNEKRCCLSRPSVVSSIPAQSDTGVCLQQPITVTFSKEMWDTTFPGNWKVENADGSKDYTSDMQFSMKGKSKVSITPTGSYDPSEIIKVTFKGDPDLTDNVDDPASDGVTSTQKVGMDGDEVITFTTGTANCELIPPGGPCKDVTYCPEGPSGLCSGNTSCMSAAVEDCRCCCTPGDTWDVGHGVILECKKNVASCTGTTRGVFCGCTEHSQCGDPSNAVGCGETSEGMCCVPRPTFELSDPAQDASSICRTLPLQYYFSQEMTISTLAGNYRVRDQDGIVLTDKFTLNTRRQDGKTIAILTPTVSMPANKKIFVTWVGDADVANAPEYGVLNIHKLAMNDATTEFKFTTSSDDCVLIPPGGDCKDAAYCPAGPTGICKQGTRCLSDATDCKCCCLNGETWDTGNGVVLDCVQDVLSCTGGNRGLFCGCQNGSDGKPDDVNCPDPSTVGCGKYNNKGFCCLPRPTIIASTPADGAINTCPNILMTFTFDQEMDLDSLRNNFELKAGSTPLNSYGNLQFKVDNSGPKPRTRAEFRLSKMLPTDADIQAVWKGDSNPADDVYEGVLNEYGIGMNGPDSHNRIINFHTADSLCEVKKVGVKSGFSNNTFTKPDTTTNIDATAYSDPKYGPVELTPIDGVYAWQWDWNSDQAAIIGLSDKADCSASATTTEHDASRYATICGINLDGMSTISAAAVPTSNPGSYSGTKKGLMIMQVYFCQDPWAEGVGDDGKVSAPLGFADVGGTDDDAGALLPYNMAIQYCRDGHTPPSNFNRMAVRDRTTDTLPAGVLREYLFTQSSPLSKHNGIGIRIFSNPDRLSATRWYQAHAPNPTENYKVITDGVGGINGQEGYDAIQVGRTVYIAGANHGTDVDGLVSTALYTNMYVFSYTQGATQETIDIFNEMLGSWMFNLNLNTYTKERQALIRDTKRITELGAMAQYLLDYKDLYGGYPDLSAGSFLENQSTSRWNSWYNILGAAIGNAPADPINAFSPLSSCKPEDGFDAAENCWKPDDKQYHCPNDGKVVNSDPVTDWGAGGSHVYQYKTTGSNFEMSWLFANLEYFHDGLTWAIDSDGDGTVDPTTETVLDPCDGSSSCPCFNYGLKLNLDAKEIVSTDVPSF